MVTHLDCTLGKRDGRFSCHDTSGNRTLLAVTHALCWNSERPNYLNSYLEIFFVFIKEAAQGWSEWLFRYLLLTLLGLLSVWCRLNLWKGFCFLTGACGTSKAFIPTCLCCLKRRIMMCMELLSFMKTRISTWYKHCLQSLMWFGQCNAKNSLGRLLIGKPSQMWSLPGTRTCF